MRGGSATIGHCITWDGETETASCPATSLIGPGDDMRQHAVANATMPSSGDDVGTCSAGETVEKDETLLLNSKDGDCTKPGDGVLISNSELDRLVRGIYSLSRAEFVDSETAVLFVASCSFQGDIGCNAASIDCGKAFDVVNSVSPGEGEGVRGDSTGMFRI